MVNWARPGWALGSQLERLAGILDGYLGLLAEVGHAIVRALAGHVHISDRDRVCLAAPSPSR